MNAKKEVINNILSYKVTGENTLVVIGGFNSNDDEKTIEANKQLFKANIESTLKNIDETMTLSRYINIGKTFGDYIRNTAFLTLGIAIVAIALYIAWAFSGVVSGVNIFSFSTITIITLFHDVIIATGIYIFASFFFKEFQIDTYFITALLTILGYSINDTIVILDRIRTNLGNFSKGKNKKNLEDIINLSVNETLTRSIYTSLTLLIVLFTIFFFGPEAISGFVLVMIFGTIIGTYSSIFLASPLLFEMNKNAKIEKFEKKEVNIEDKIVV